jgi:hypothetical protein
MLVRVYCEENEAEGQDEGGSFRMKEVPDLPKKLKRRLPRCIGCRNNFYNGRANVSGNHCWSLERGAFFRGRGKPKCWHS